MTSITQETAIVGRVREIWRYPVKSMQGERLASGHFTPLGLDGDRRWALRDLATGKLISAKQNRQVLEAGAELDGGRLSIRLPDGTRLAEDQAGINEVFSQWLGRGVVLEHAGPSTSGVYEFYTDPEDENSEPIEFSTPDGTFLDAAALHILTTSSLHSISGSHPGSTWDQRRFRPTFLVEVDADGYVEDGWVGSSIGIGAVEATVVSQTIRCGIPGRAQPNLDADGEIVRILKQSRRSLLGVYAAVDVAGEVSEGDPVLLRDIL